MIQLTIVMTTKMTIAITIQKTITIPNRIAIPSTPPGVVLQVRRALPREWVHFR